MDDSSGEVPEDYWISSASDGSAVDYDYVAEPSIQGNGSLLLNYSVKHLMNYGGYASMYHMAEGDKFYNLAGCTQLSFWFNVLTPPSRPVDFRFVLLDGSECDPTCYNVGEDTLRGLEWYYAFPDILSSGPGWRRFSVELRADANSASAPFQQKPWNGIDGNKALDAARIKGFGVEMAFRKSPGSFGKVAAGALAIDGLECTGARVLGSAFEQPSWASARSARQWIELSNRSGDDADGARLRWDLVPDTTPQLQGTLEVAEPAPAVCVCDASGAPQMLQPELELDSGRFWLVHSLPAGAYYNLSEAGSVKLWASGTDAFSARFHLFGVGIGAIDFNATGERGLMEALAELPALDLDLPTTAEAIELELNLSSPTSSVSCSQGALEDAQSCVDVAMIRGFGVEVSMPASKVQLEGALLVLQGLLPYWPGGEQLSSDGEPDVEQPYVLEEGVIFDLWSDPTAEKADMIGVFEDCAQLCLNNTSCAFFVYRSPPDMGNCAFSQAVHRSLMIPRDVQHLPPGHRGLQELRDFTYITGWVRSRQPEACGENGVCHCSRDTAARASVACAGKELTIMPRLSPEWAQSVRHLDLEGSSISLLTRSLLGPAPSLESLAHGGVGFLEPQLLAELPVLQSVRASREPLNIIQRGDGSRYGNVCCSRGTSVVVGGVEMSPCNITVATSGVDCVALPRVVYYGERFLVKEVHPGSLREGWATHSHGACCELCRGTTGCTHWVFDNRISAPPRCYLKSAGEERMENYEPDRGGGPGFVSGWTPEFRAKSGDVVLQATVPGHGHDFQLAPTDDGNYSFEYDLSIKGPIRRGAVWIRPESEPGGLVVEPPEVQFNGHGRAVRMMVRVSDFVKDRLDSTTIILRHEVVACDEAWNALSKVPAGDLRVVVEPMCSPGFAKVSVGGSRACRMCQAGTFSEGGNGECRPCLQREAAVPGSSSCVPCAVGLKPGASGCEFPVIYYLMSLIFVALISGGLGLLLSEMGRRVPVKDIKLQDGALRVVTTTPHRIVELRHPPVVRLFGTERDDDCYRARIRGAHDFELLTQDGKPINRIIDTSIGYVRLERPRQLINGTCGSMPAWVIVSFCLCGGGQLLFIEQLRLNRNEIGISPWVYVPMLVVVSASGALCMALARHHRRSQLVSPILRSVDDYRRRLADKRWEAQPSERGANRGLEVGKMLDLHECFMEYIGARSMHYICSDIVKPLTCSRRLSFSEFVGPCQAEWFVSHFWGSPFKDFANTIQMHAKAFAPLGDEAWRQVPYWICTFSVNQWNISEEVGDGEWRRSSFYRALRSPSCCGTVMVMDPEVKPLTRSWCLFELLQTFVLQQDNPDFEFLLGTVNGVLNHGGVTDINLALRIGRTIAHLDLKDAEASDVTDKAMINSLVEDSGGFETMNNFIRQKVQDVLLVVRNGVEGGFNELHEMLARTTAADVKDVTTSPRISLQNRSRSPESQLTPSPRRAVSTPGSRRRRNLLRAMGTRPIHPLGDISAMDSGRSAAETSHDSPSNQLAQFV